MELPRRVRANGRSRPFVWALTLILAACGGGSGTTGLVPREVSAGPQIALVTPTSIVVAWRTSVESEGRLELAAPGEEWSEPVAAPSIGKEHVFALSGLETESTYFYRIWMDDEIVGGSRSFRTAPLEGTGRARFAVWGDSGTGSREQLEVASLAAATDPDLVLITGDVVYSSGAPHEIRPHYFEPYADFIDHVPFYPCLGNHDVRSAGGRPLLEALYLPTNSADATESFYSFDYGPVHFVALNSNVSLAPGSTQFEWLDLDLGASDAAWTVVYLHHPPYSSSLHGSDVELQATLGALLDEHRVDVVFAGHDHNYERTAPIRGQVVRPTASSFTIHDAEGSIYVVTGGGGRGLYASGTSAFTIISASVHHFCLVEATVDEFVFSARRIGDIEIDRFTLTKTRE